MVACKDASQTIRQCGVKETTSDMPVSVGKAPRTVIRGVNSQISNEVGVHWLRISFDRKFLSEIVRWCSHFWGESDQDGFGLWSYDSRTWWSSGVSLNFDAAKERSLEVHNGRITLECPGKALDELTSADLGLFLEGCDYAFCGKCTRVDVFLDDYNRTMSPTELHDIIKRGDYSGFRIGHIAQTRESGRLTHDQVMFGRRGEKGSGKYLRIYDKALESKGEKDCIRYEVEFTQDKAQQVFKKLCKTQGDIEAFATLCGSLVGGCVNFVKRTGDKNIGRLDVYEFWSIIRDTIGSLVIRAEKKVNNLTGVLEWTQRQVAPSLACLRKVWRNDQEFFNWMLDVLDDGDSRMGPHKTALAQQYEGTIGYHRKCNLGKQEADYINIISGLDG